MANLERTRSKPGHTPGTPAAEAIRKPVNRYEDDATGINIETRIPIDPGMPHMPPA